MIASLTPAVLLVCACIWGGVWPILAVLAMTVMVFSLDKLAWQRPLNGASGQALSLVLAVVHFMLLALGVLAIGSPDLEAPEKVLLFTGFGLFFGQISNSNAHELIHNSGRRQRLLGMAVYVSLLHGHHVSAHLRVHHVHVATDADPNTARIGEGFWAYLLRALPQEFMAGFHADTAIRARAQRALPPLSHPYFVYVAGGFATLGAAYAISGPAGSLALLGFAAYAQMQLLLSDYVQHYGLRRRVDAAGKPEPIGPRHSWNAPHWYSAAMLLNAPRHSDHHTRPACPYPALEMSEDMPLLPHSLPVMAVLALVPPLWRRIMDRRVARWQNLA